MSIIIGIILLGVLIFLHELGHFLASKACGVKVEAFSIGMGPILLHKEWRGTDWRFSLFPFGGYCAMKGEKDLEESFYSNAELEKDSFYGVKAIFRAIIGFAGPLANFLFAVFAFFVIALTGYTYYAAGNTIQLANEVYPELHSAASDAGILSGDKIIQINGKDIADFSALQLECFTHPNEDIFVTVNRNGEILTFTVHTDRDEKTGYGRIGVMSNFIEKQEVSPLGFFPAMREGFFQTVKLIQLSFRGIATLFKGAKVSANVNGVFSSSHMLGETAKSGFSAGFKSGVVSVLQFMALISVSLFIMNLLPIPILDGFLVVASLIEAIFHIRISPKVRNVVQYVGIALIAALFLLALSGDFHYFVGILQGKK